MPHPRNAIALIAAVLLALPGAAAAQNPALPGSYALDEEASDPIRPAIEQAIARMNFITRPVARGRLTRTNEPYRAITIRQSGEEISIITDDRAPIVARPDGNPARWQREDGEELDLTTRWDGPMLEQTFVAEDGQRRNVYSLAPDGDTLELDVTVTSPRLPAPLTYTLRYRRQ